MTKADAMISWKRKGAKSFRFFFLLTRHAHVIVLFFILDRYLINAVAHLIGILDATTVHCRIRLADGQFIVALVVRHHIEVLVDIGGGKHVLCDLGKVCLSLGDKHLVEKVFYLSRLAYFWSMKSPWCFRQRRRSFSDLVSDCFVSGLLYTVDDIIIIIIKGGYGGWWKWSRGECIFCIERVLLMHCLCLYEQHYSVGSFF